MTQYVLQHIQQFKVKSLEIPHEKLYILFT